MTALKLESREISCPYCGEQVQVEIDCSVASQHYIEDCQVCCSPIIFDVEIEYEGFTNVNVRSENE